MVKCINNLESDGVEQGFLNSFSLSLFPLVSFLSLSPKYSIIILIIILDFLIEVLYLLQLGVDKAVQPVDSNNSDCCSITSDWCKGDCVCQSLLRQGQDYRVDVNCDDASKCHHVNGYSPSHAIVFTLSCSLSTVYIIGDKESSWSSIAVA